MATKQQIIDKAVSIAKAEEGTRESGGSNRGRRVDEYQRADTLPGEGYAWCASFTSWVLKQTAAQLKIERIAWSYSASCDVVWADGRKRGLMHNTPQKGDIMLVRARKGGGYSDYDAIHTGIVEKVHQGEFVSVEGNTNSDGGREGHSVMRHTHPISARYVFVRWIDGVEIAAEPPKPPKVEHWTVTLKDGARALGVVTNAYDGRPVLPTRRFAEFYGLTVAWDAKNMQAVIGGKAIESQVRMKDGASLYPVRVLAETMGYNLTVDSAARKVVVTR